MSWEIEYRPEARKELTKLNQSVYPQIVRGIRKVAQNPLSRQEGGYGEALGHHNGLDLTGLLKIKFKKPGIRVIYQLKREHERMVIVVIGIRSDEEVYRVAAKRKENL